MLCNSELSQGWSWKIGHEEKGKGFHVEALVTGNRHSIAEFWGALCSRDLIFVNGGCLICQEQA